MADTPVSRPPNEPTPSESWVPTRPERVRPFFEPPAAPVVAAAFSGYEFLRELGRGGMGVVYLARNRLLDRLEAVKVMSRPWSGDRFRQEVRASARLRHPNVVTVYSALTGDGHLAFAMEYVEGETLARLTRVRGPLPAAVACGYARQVALGLQHAHERGMTHRDVKPQNLMLCRADGREVVKILDFGLAKLGAATPEADAVTTDGELLGTPGYAAPEQIRDASTTDIRADVYALGVTLWFLLTGEHPTARAPEPGAPDPDRRGWPKGLAAVLARMTAFDPADRFQTPAEVAAALEPFASEYPDAPAGSAGHKPRRLVWCAAIGLVLLLVAGAALVGPSGAPVPAADEPAAPSPEARFVSVFNGTDLSGWVVDGGSPDQWRVESGALVTTGTRTGPQTWLLSAREYGTVRVRFEYQLDAGGNSGFAFRAVPGERPVLSPGGLPTPAPYHQQVELSDDAAKEWRWLPTGQIPGGVGRTAPALKPVRPARLRPAPEWNAVEIELSGQALKVTLNGDVIQTGDLDQLIASGSSYPALSRTKGRIGFQQFAKTVRFRAVEVLEPGEVAPEGSVGSR